MSAKPARRVSAPRVPKWVFNSNSVYRLSFLFAVAMGALWARSMRHEDSIGVVWPVLFGEHQTAVITSWSGRVHLLVIAYPNSTTLPSPRADYYEAPVPPPSLLPLTAERVAGHALGGFRVGRDKPSTVSWWARAAAVIPHYALCVLLSILPLARVVWLIRSRRRTRDKNACPVCGYDLRATPDRCPECGTIGPANL
jgi:hypothetical protein